MTTEELRKTILYLDGIRYSVSMADVAARRLRVTLDEVAVRHAASQEAEEQVVSALLDAWSIIDMCHRARELVQATPGLSQKLRGIQVFLRGTSHIEDLRHYVQHFRKGIPNVPTSWTPLWGGLSWIPTQESTTCYIIFTGSLLEGLQTPSIAYDTHELRFAADIVLYVGTAQVDLLSVAIQMSNLRDCLLAWVEEHPKLLALTPTHGFGQFLCCLNSKMFSTRLTKRRRSQRPHCVIQSMSIVAAVLQRAATCACRSRG